MRMIMYATVPVIAAIRGGCLGGGLEIALSCHFRIASRNALFGFPECRHGLMPALGGSVMSGRLLSRRAAVDLILSGRMFDGGEAVEMGLVDVLASSGTVMDRAMDFARDLVGDRSPELIRAVMESIHNSVRMTREEALVRETELFMQVASGDRERT
jgi:enoyl-CoA hydratase/carnithine racemase